MAIFPSEEWMKALQEVLNGSKQYEKAAKRWKGALVTEILPEEGKLDNPVYLYMNPVEGRVVEACALKKLEEKDAPYVMTAKFSVWKDIIQGKYDGTQAIMKGKMKLKGNMQELMKNVAASQIMMNEMKKLDTVFIDEQQKS